MQVAELVGERALPLVLWQPQRIGRHGISYFLDLLYYTLIGPYGGGYKASTTHASKFVEASQSWGAHSDNYRRTLKKISFVIALLRPMKWSKDDRRSEVCWRGD